LLLITAAAAAATSVIMICVLKPQAHMRFEWVKRQTGIGFK